MTAEAEIFRMSRALASLHAKAFDKPWSAETFVDLLNQPTVILEVETDGFVLVQVAADEGEILTLAVLPAARRRGVASRLIEAAAVRVAGLGGRRLFLEVAEDNLAARALYRRLDFQPVGRRPRYYARMGGPAVDALLLARNLTAPLPSA